MESDLELNLIKCKMNSDYSILTTILEKEIKFFETKNFKEIEALTEKHIGHSKLAFPIHRSNIIIILGTKANSRFPENTVHLWDIEKKESIGSINIKIDSLQPDDILFDVFLANSYLFLISRYRIYMFDLMTLEHEFTFEDVYGVEGGVSFSFSERKIVIAYISNSNHSIVKINKIRIIKNGLEYSQRFLSTDFPNIQYIKVSPRYKYLAVADSNGEKINLYSLRSYKIKKYFWRGYGNVKIYSIFFDSDNNYIGLYSTQKTLHIYPISELNYRKRVNYPGRRSNRPSIHINNSISMNNEEDEEQINAIRGKKKNKIKGIMKNIRKKIYNKYIESFARYKDDKILFRDIVFAFFNESNDVIIIDKIGKIFIIKFNKKNGGQCWLIENKKLDCNT
jgi:WD40 repeat protein